jgi:hypothetical protein
VGKRGSSFMVKGNSFRNDLGLFAMMEDKICFVGIG